MTMKRDGRRERGLVADHFRYLVLPNRAAYKPGYERASSGAAGARNRGLAAVTTRDRHERQARTADARGEAVSADPATSAASARQAPAAEGFGRSYTVAGRHRELHVREARPPDLRSERAAGFDDRVVGTARRRRQSREAR